MITPHDSVLNVSMYPNHIWPNSLITGTDSDVSGNFSAIDNMRTEKARSTVMPRAIFSPESGGRQKTRRVRVLIMIQG